MKKASYLLLVAFGLIISLAPHHAIAQQRDKEKSNCNSEITFNLSHEEWIKASTVKVIVNISLLGKEDEIIDIKNNAINGLKKILDSEWIVTNYRRSKDPSGLTRLNITAQTRIKEKLLSGIFRRAKAKSSEGIQFKVTGIRYTPTLKEMEEARARARVEIYKMAFDEARKIKEVLKKDITVFKINFEPLSVFRAMEPYVKGKRATEFLAAKPAPVRSNIERRVKVKLNAEVILKTCEKQ